MTQQEDRLAQLRAKLAARENKPGMKKNVEQLRAEIAALEAQIGAD